MMWKWLLLIERCHPGGSLSPGSGRSVGMRLDRHFFGVFFRINGLLFSMARTRFCWLVILLLISGCSKKQAVNDAEPVVLRVISAGGPNRISEEEAVRRFQAKNPGIQVEMLSAPGRDYYVKALAIMAAGGDLDILWMGSGFGLFSWRGALLPLDPLLESDPNFDLNRYESEVVDWYRHGGALLGIPYGIDLQVIAYNRDALEAAGISDPSPDWTFAEFLKIAGELSLYGKQNPESCSFGAGVDKIAPYYFGLSLVDDTGGRSGLQGATAELWLKTNVELLRSGGDFLRVGAQGTLDRLGEFLQGRVAMVEAYTWDVGELRNRAQFPWAFAVNPLATNGERAGWASSSGFAISARTKHPKEAWLLLKELVGVEMQVSLMATTIPARRDLQAQYVTANDVPGANLKAMLEMIPFMRESPRIPELMEVSQELDYWFELALQEDTDVTEIVPQMNHGIDRILTASPARQ
jgi:multiple sugar transport system substrate-binding protein